MVERVARYALGARAPARDDGEPANPAKTNTPGLAYESIELQGRRPETLFVIRFRKLARPEFPLGWRFRFWPMFSALSPEGNNLNGRLARYADLIRLEFIEEVYEHDLVESDWPTERLRTSAINWIRTAIGHGADVDGIAPD